MDEFKLMVSDPVTLYNYYITIITSGESLTMDQIIKFTYVESLVNGEL